MFRNCSIVVIILAACLTASAQTTTGQNDSGSGSFADFRKSILEDYNKFRTSILEDYDRFLEAAWDDYQQMRGIDRYETPKPHVAPAIPTAPIPESKPVSVPEPEAKKEPLKKPEPVVPKPEKKTVPPVVAEPDQPGNDLYTFPFYGMDMKITDRGVDLSRRLSSTNDFANQWRSLAGDKAEGMIPSIKKTAGEHGLNDYLTFRLIRSYVNSRYPQAHPSARVALEHYLLANMGYDVRLAVDDSGTPLLLIPFGQDVYGRPYLMVGSRKYYVFQPDGVSMRPEARIMTCKLPSNSDLGNPMDLRIDALRLPDNPKEFKITYGDITLTGKVNENIMKVVYDYPQMSIADFAVSELSPTLRASLVDQLKVQLNGLDEQEAVDKLLQFTQSAFEYATDQDFHGFEKPYFLEEILFYPKCDCEDRSIFYTYMLWNVLGVENHLLAYPGHESASVHLNAPVSGNSYEWNGKTYYISDPTYIGAKTGMCMPVYAKVRPEVDYEYKSVR